MESYLKKDHVDGRNGEMLVKGYELSVIGWVGSEYSNTDYNNTVICIEGEDDEPWVDISWNWAMGTKGIILSLSTWVLFVCFYNNWKFL